MMRRRRRIEDQPSLAGWFDGMRADYDAAKSSRFQRKRTGVSLGGSGADYHFRSEADYLRLMEYSRDLDRNDLAIGIWAPAKLFAVDDFFLAAVGIDYRAETFDENIQVRVIQPNGFTTLDDFPFGDT